MLMLIDLLRAIGLQAKLHIPNYHLTVYHHAIAQLYHRSIV